MSKKTSTSSLVPVKNLTGTATINLDLSANLTLNDLLEIIVEEENEYRKILREKCNLNHVDFSNATEKFKLDAENFIKTKFKKVISDLTPHFGNLSSAGFGPYCHTMFFDFPKAKIQTKYCYVHPVLNLSESLNYLNSCVGNHYSKSIIADVSLKSTRIAVNKELLSKKIMTNQEIYTKVRELISVPKETSEKIEIMRNKYIQNLSFDTSCIKIN